MLELLPNGLAVGPIEAIDGTPVVDVKPVADEADNFQCRAWPTYGA